LPIELAIVDAHPSSEDSRIARRRRRARRCLQEAVSVESIHLLSDFSW
jgi:hypothetical protein